jgi:hypothetical protein
VTRVCKYEPCSKEFEPTHPRQVFCEPTCRTNQHYLEHPEKGRSLQGGALRSVATHPLDKAREVQALQKEKRMWRLVIEIQIGRTLLETGHFHADNLDPLEVPREHRQLNGTRTGGVSGEGLMVKTGDERARANPASNGRKSSIYRITRKGQQEFTKWIDDRERKLVGLGTGKHGDAREEAVHSSPLSTPASVESGESSVEETAAIPCPRPFVPPALDAASPDQASGALVTPAPDASASEALSLLPEPPRMFDPDLRRAA